MNKIQDYFIRDSLPESINHPGVKELARLTDAVLHKFDDRLLDILIYPAIDNLPSDLVDALAIQLHCDFYDSSLPLSKRRKLVKTSIAWHRIKGTPAAVEMLLRTLFNDAHVKEWFEYGGRPYYFRVEVDISDTEEGFTSNSMAQITKAIELGKNVRSWLDLLEFKQNIREELEIIESRFWIVHIVKSDKEYYPWRGRNFDTSWTFTDTPRFDGLWLYDGQYHFDGIPVGAEDGKGAKFAFDGDWWFDGVRRFGYPVSRKVLWGNAEPDELAVVPMTASKEKYTVELPFDALEPFDTGWAFGARDGPQDARFDVGVAPILKELLGVLDNSDEALTIVRTVLRDVYPLARILDFDGSWAFRQVLSFDGSWSLGKDPGYRYGDNRFEPWLNLPVSFFSEQKYITETFYDETALCFDGDWDFKPAKVRYFGERLNSGAPLCFDGSWPLGFTGERYFGEILSIPHTTNVEAEYGGPRYDGSWQFFGIHDADAFWDEDSQERLRVSDRQVETERVQAQEKSLLQTGPGFAESILRCPAFDGSWQFEGVNILGTSRDCFEPLSAFGEGMRFGDRWAFGMCSRIFDGSWNLGEDPLHFDGDWHFGGEMHFASNDIHEEADADVHACLSESLEHRTYFGTDRTVFDGLWNFGGSDGLQETSFSTSVSHTLSDGVSLDETGDASLRVVIRDIYPLPHVLSFDATWKFLGVAAMDGSWVFDGCEVQRFGDTHYEPWKNQRILSFDEQMCFDGSWQYFEPHGRGVFGSEDAQEHFATTSDFIEFETVQAQETTFASTGLALNDALLHVNFFDGAWRFGEEVCFASDDIPEKAETEVHTCMSESIEHHFCFGTDWITFDGLWEFGVSSGLKEHETTLQVATAIIDSECIEEEATVSLAVSFREVLPSAPVVLFDGGWRFAGMQLFDGNWHFAESQVFGASEHDCPVFRQEMETEYLHVDEEPNQNYCESIHRANAFNGILTFDDSWSFGDREGMSEGLAVSVTSVLRFDDTWAFDDEPRKIDGTWNLGDDYAFGDNVSPRNTYDGSWNFDSMNTRIRFERRWRSFGSITIAA